MLKRIGKAVVMLGFLSSFSACGGGEIVRYQLHDGAGNGYKLFRGAKMVLEYEPVKPRESSSGVYDGGDFRQKKLSEVEYQKIEKLFQQAAGAKEDQIENRVMGSGRIVIERGQEKKVYILRPGAPVFESLRDALKAILQ